MRERGFSSKSALAAEVGVNRSTVGHWLKGEPLTVPSLSKLAAALRTTRSWILDGDASELPPGEAEMLLEEIARNRTDFLDSLTALAKESGEQRKALEGLLSRVERLEQQQVGSRN